MLHVLEWLYDDTDLTPARLLAAHGNPMAAARVMAITNLRPAQKDGLYDGARRFLEVLDEPAYAGWVTPPRRRVFTQLGDDMDITLAAATHDVLEFSPTTFAAGTDTLYALSMEGPESASALSTALIGQVFEAASRLAATLPGRRLGTPLTVILDEAANVCKLAELPNLYSHFGSRGIVVMTIFQSAVQGYEVWGENGFRKLWSAANLKMYGGGVSDEPWLRELSNLIGVHDVSRWSQSTGRGGASRSQSWSSEPILDVAELMGLPRGRAVLLSSATRRPCCASCRGWKVRTRWPCRRRCRGGNQPIAGRNGCGQPTSSPPMAPAPPMRTMTVFWWRRRPHGDATPCCPRRDERHRTRTSSGRRPGNGGTCRACAPGVRRRRGVRGRVPGPHHRPQARGGGPGADVVPAVVDARRSHRPADGPVGGVGSAASGWGHRDGHLVA